MKSIALSVLAAIAIASALVIFIGSAVAAPPQLKGGYAVSGATTCLVSNTVRGGIPITPSGFNSDLTPRGFSFIVSSSVNAVRTFNGDGTGTATGRSITIASTPQPDPDPPAPGSF